MPSLQIQFFTNKQRIKLLTVACAVSRQFTSALDVLFYTPLRDLQVFAPRSFSQITGIIPHPLWSIVLISTSIIGSLPFIGKIFHQNQEIRLESLLRHLREELGDGFKYSHQALQEKFNAILNKKDIYYLRSTIIEKKKRRLKHFFRRKKEIALRFQLIEPLKKIFGQEWNIYKDKNLHEIVQSLLTHDDLPAILLLLKSLGTEITSTSFLTDLLLDHIKKNPQSVILASQYNEKIITISILCYLFLDHDQAFKEITLEHNRKQFLEKLNQLNVYDLFVGTYDFLSDCGFNYWLGLFTYDLLVDDINPLDWSFSAQITVPLVALMTTTIQYALKISDYWLHHRKATPSQFNHYFKHRTLKEELLTTFFLSEINHQCLNEAQQEKNQLSISQAKNLERYITTRLNIGENSEKKPKSMRYIDLLRNESSTTPQVPSRINRAFFFLKNMMRPVITISNSFGFIKGILILCGAIAVVTSTLNNPFALGLLGASLLIGLGYAYYHHRQDKKNKSELRSRLDTVEEQITQLEDIEYQNKQFISLLKQHGLTPLTSIKPHDDRAFRRLSRKKKRQQTIAKKTLNRLFIFIGSGGTGILLYRFSIPLLTIAGVGGAMVTGPAGLGIALGLGIAWAGLNLYLYHRQSKLAVAKRLLHDIDHRLACAQANQIIFLTQLRYQHTVEVASRSVSLNNNTLYQEVPSPNGSIPVNLPKEPKKQHCPGKSYIEQLAYRKKGFHLFHPLSATVRSLSGSKNDLANLAHLDDIRPRTRSFS